MGLDDSVIVQSLIEEKVESNQQLLPLYELRNKLSILKALKNAREE
jgi:hypothetical protein